MKPVLTKSSTVVASGDLVSAPLGAESMMMDVDKGMYYWMDGIGTSVWERIKVPTTLGALCTDLQAEYDVPPERCEADVRAFLEELRRKGLVTVGDEGA